MWIQWVKTLYCSIFIQLNVEGLTRPAHIFSSTQKKNVTLVLKMLYSCHSPATRSYLRGLRVFRNVIAGFKCIQLRLWAQRSVCINVEIAASLCCCCCWEGCLQNIKSVCYQKKKEKKKKTLLITTSERWWRTRAAALLPFPPSHLLPHGITAERGGHEEEKLQRQIRGAMPPGLLQLGNLRN